MPQKQGNAPWDLHILYWNHLKCRKPAQLRAPIRSDQRARKGKSVTSSITILKSKLWGRGAVLEALQSAEVLGYSPGTLAEALRSSISPARRCWERPAQHRLPGAGFCQQNLDPEPFLISSWPGAVIAVSVVVSPPYKCTGYSSAHPCCPCLRALGDTNTGCCPCPCQPWSCKIPLLPLSDTFWGQERHPDGVDLERQEAERFAFIIYCCEWTPPCLILSVKVVTSTGKSV